MVAAEQDIPSFRKRRKTVGECFASHYLFGQGKEVKGFEGKELLPKQPPQIMMAYNKLTITQHRDNSTPIMCLSPGNRTTNHPVHNENNRPQDNRLTAVHTDQNSTARLSAPQSSETRDNLKEILVNGKGVVTEESRTYGPVCSLKLPPRVYIRSNSAFPEAVNLYKNTDTYSVKGQFDRRRRVNSQPTLKSGNSLEHVLFNNTIHSISKKDLWTPTRMSSGDLTIKESCQRIRSPHSLTEMRLDVCGCRSQVYLPTEPSMEDGVNEGLQHIGNCKSLWFVVAAILGGIFLCMFLYAFHIIK